MGTMATLEAAVRPIPAGAKPGLVVLKNGNRPMRGQCGQDLRINQVVDLDDIRVEFPRRSQVSIWIGPIPKAKNGAIHLRRALVSVGKAHRRPGPFKPMARLDHDPVHPAVVTAGRFVDQQYSHRPTM